jgi:hypothetical protein
MQLEVIDKFGRVRRFRHGDILADGERLRVPHTFMDHASYGFRPTFSDGTPDHTNPHRPGYRFADIDDADRLAADKAYEERRTRMQNAWKNATDADTPVQRRDAANARAVADRAYEDRKVRLTNAWRNNR